MHRAERLREPTDEVVSGREPWLLAGLLIAVAPALHTLATWDLDGRLSSQAFAVRHYSYVIMVIELCVIWLAARNELSLTKAISALPTSVSVLLGAWFAFALAALFSSVTDLANATLILARYTIHGFFLIALVHLVRNANEFEIRRWLAVLSVGAVVYVLLLVVFSVLVPDTKNFRWVLRLPSATNIRQIGNNVGILMIAPTVLLLSKGKSRLLPYALAFIVVLAFATWTGSRASLLGFAIGVTVGLLIVRNFSTVQNACISGLSAVAGILISLVVPVPHTSFGLFRLFKTSGEQIDTSSGRLELWTQTWQQILHSPWFGYGSGRFAREMNRLYGVELNHPHNFILQYFYDWGVFGGTTALLVLAILGLKILQKKDADPIARFAAITAYCAICSMAMIDSPLFHPLPIAVALALIAPVFAKQENIKNSGQTV